MGLCTSHTYFYNAGNQDYLFWNFFIPQQKKAFLIPVLPGYSNDTIRFFNRPGELFKANDADAGNIDNHNNLSIK